MLGYQREIEQNLRVTGCEIVSAGLVDNQPAAQEARSLFSREDVDLVICYVGTYASSSQVVPHLYSLAAISVASGRRNRVPGAGIGDGCVIVRHTSID